MPAHLQPPSAPKAPTSPGSSDEDHDTLRLLSRSPHPYHRLNTELLEPSGRLTNPRITTGDNDSVAGESDGAPSRPFPAFARDSPLTSESGTEADDEHFLKGLPAPRAKSHKGLRGRNEPLSGTSTPLLSPSIWEEEGRKTNSGSGHGGHEREKRGAAERVRRRKELVRRATEVLLLIWQGGMVASNAEARSFIHLYRKEFLAVGGVFCGLTAAYPLRLVSWAYRQGKPQKLVPIRVPASFDPAPILYPPVVPVLVSLLIAENVEGAVLPSLVLSICALPRPLIPGARHWETLSCTHWLLSCVPFTLDALVPAAEAFLVGDMSREVLVLLYPLHQTLCLVLHHLTTTSLLVSELQLLSAALIGLLLLASSPQAVILKAVLWGGGLGLAVFCGQVIHWGILLARVPKWRFRRTPSSARSESGYQLLWQLLPFRRRRSASLGSVASDTDYSIDEYLDGALPTPPKKTVQADSLSDVDIIPPTPAGLTRVQSDSVELLQQSPARRHTLPATGKPPGRPKVTTTPSGRRKRAASTSVRALFSLTQTQATIRKWLYASYVYLCILLVIFVGIRPYVQHYALSGHEPVGWALGYLFGDIPQFRFQVVKANLERWIPLPALLSALNNTNTTTHPSPASCTPGDGGWAQHTRLGSLGAANTRLALSAYFLLTILTGLAVVFRLSPVYEVDTRRKVFHFMMVAMFLPTLYVDPCYAALALAIVLAVFLLLDLLRASQLPPLSRPLARFLTPYVDGRDLRGPVVVSHIFLLIGCAIPVWLSLASLPRITTTPPVSAEEPAPAVAAAIAGWEVPAREVGMVSGVVCVGLGDAAASLVGRRWGHRKWLWGGGKSVEGSAAFAAAVFVGLMVAALWLRVGGWAVAGASFDHHHHHQAESGMESLMSVLDWAVLWPWLRVEVPKTVACASLASLTEAVLTGGNDNVVVPVVLWGCVKSLGV
ncbi:uncharacterized protein B0H64DRAFT_338589 [Chaetomium fimeti]|uniref:dolichol kinase n=1 Tax=Chaetomium fimeti TaxID=1854472 RepID=A0AAE0HI51_9PEZI|nr:hypothetical protein B0H64DRAFT_338589 [Chaetomium fimeti]